MSWNSRRQQDGWNQPSHNHQGYRGKHGWRDGGDWNRYNNNYNNNRGYHNNQYRNSNPQQQQHNYGSYRDPHEERKRREEGPSASSRQQSQSYSSFNHPNMKTFQEHESLDMKTRSGSMQASNGRMNERMEMSTASTNNAINLFPKKFEDMTWKEKLEDQLSGAHMDFDLIPEEIKGKPADDMLSKKKDAFNYATQKVLQRLKSLCDEQNEDYDDDDDDDDDSKASYFSMYSDDFDDGGPYSKKRKKEPKYSEKQVIKFFKGLTDNVVFDMGFKVCGVHADDEKNCWCPCGKHMSRWRQCFELENLAGKGSEAFCEVGSKMVPSGLMSHVRKIGNTCPLHYGISMYLEKLYGDWNGKGHKGLFFMGDKKYKVAEAAEKKVQAKLLSDAIKEKNEAEHRVYQAELEIKRREEEKKTFMRNLKLRNPDFYTEMEELNDTFKVLKIDDQEVEAEPDKESRENFDSLLTECFRNMLRLGVNKKPAKINVEQKFGEDFDINAVFAKMEKKKEGTFIEKSIDKLVLDWDVQFSALEVSSTSKKKQKESKAIDKGGPTRAFYSKVWEYLFELAVQVNGKDEKIEINLFEMTPGGLIPVNDDKLILDIERASKRSNPKCSKEQILFRVKNYYRAIGILLFRAITSESTIRHSIMPNFYRNVFLRNIEPKDAGKYTKCQMLQNLKAIDLNYIPTQEDRLMKSHTPGKNALGCSSRAGAILNRSIKTLKEDGIISEHYNAHDDETIIDEKNFFTIFLQFSVIETRRIAIDSIKRGLSLKGPETENGGDSGIHVNLPVILSMTSLKYLSEKLFAKSSIEANDLIERLVLMREPPQNPTTHQKTRVQVQDSFFEGTLKDVIREMSYEEREKLTSFCTGYSYLPRSRDGDDFQIFILFNHKEMDEDSLPVAHTCENMLKLPWGVYGNNKDVFKAKLSQSMEVSKFFTIN